MWQSQQLKNDSIIHNYDPSDDWERREAERAKRAAQEICQFCGGEKGWDNEKYCDGCKCASCEDLKSHKDGKYCASCQIEAAERREDR